MDEKIICATTDSIEVLSLSVRVHNALKRAKIWDMGEVAELSDDQLFSVRNLGEKGVTEIKEQLAKVTFTDTPPIAHQDEPIKEWAGEPRILIDLGPPTIPLHEVVGWQQVIIKRQIEGGTLHPYVQVDGYALEELVGFQPSTKELYEILLKVLTAPYSISQELELLFDNVPQRELNILFRRFSYGRQTLENVASDLGLSRERVRQLQIQAISRLQKAASALQLVRIQSAILLSDDMGLSFEGWSCLLVSSGLLGKWKSEDIAGSDRIEHLLIICELLGDSDARFKPPDSLKFMVRLRNEGMSASPARMFDQINSYQGEIERMVKRHLRYSGAVSLEWLVNQDLVDISKRDLSLILESKDFFSVDENWYMSARYVPDRLEKDSVFHRSLLKMFQVCGPLEISEVYYGLEHALIKTDFPRPPIGVLSNVLLRYGYDCEEGLWYWGGETNEELNSGERIIMRTLTENNGVAHHSQLAIAFINSSVSFALLHATLRRSPLFDNFERSIYKLRGAVPGLASIQKARDSGIETPIDLEYYFDMEGNITVHASLGTLAVGHGTITSAKLPNLVGNWNLAGFGCDSVEVTENEIRGLRRALQILDCAVGDRIKMTFDTDTHEISVLRFEQT